MVERTAAWSAARAACADLQSERLLNIGMIAGGHVAADDQRQIVLRQEALELCRCHPSLSERGLLGRGQRRRTGRGWDGSRAHLDRLKLPQLNAVARNQGVGI